MTVSPLDLALYYSQQLAFTIVPVNPINKKPFTANWTNNAEKGQFGSSKEEARIRQWWSLWPGAAIGIRTGEINGIVVVDVDRHGASDGFKTLKALDGIKPAETAVVLTPGNGWHLYYRYPAKLKSGTLGAGIDFLAESRMAIAPLCVRDGKTYQYVNGHDLTALAPLPGSILAKLKRSAGQQRLDTWSAKIEATPEGERHNVVRDACWALAHDVVRGKLDEIEFRRRIADMAATCVPALDKLDVENSIESALAKLREKPTREKPAEIDDTEPWGEEVDGGQALNEAIETLRRHVILTQAQRMVAVVWALHTHLVDAGFHSPRLNLFSPMKRCGKSTLRRILAGFVARPVLGENLSPAVIYHVADAHRPTFLFDEIHLLLSHRNHDRPTLYSLMSAGYERTGTTWRMQGEGSAMTAKAFRTYSPMLLAGIGRIGGSLGDRCIPIQLKRKLKNEAVELFDFDADQAGLVDVGRKFARWAIDNADAVRAVKLDRGSFPAGWDDRQCDCARPLLKITAVLGDSWFEAVRNALGEVWRTATDADIEEDDNLTAALLADIEAAFADLYPDPQQRQEMLDPKSRAHVSSARLVELLTEDPLKPWSAMGQRQKPLTQNGLARMLRPYGVSPHMVETKSRTRGYFWRQFTDAWRRYA